MNLLICDCGGHEFIVFTGGWFPMEPTGLECPIWGACETCGKTWALDHVFWVDKPEVADDA